MSAAKRKFYVVWNGVHTGVFDNWDDCQEQIKGYPDARYKSFPTQEEAIAAYRGNPSDHLDIIKAIASRQRPVINYEAFPEIILDSIAVDAACSKNPGPVEYQGVNVRTGERLFHVGPLEGGTNNIGEFLALVHVLAWLDKLGRYDIPIYSDSRTAQAWVRTGRPKTTIQPTAQNAPIMNLLERATRWLATHQVKNRIIKWDTDNWGEIPADFGRK